MDIFLYTDSPSPSLIIHDIKNFLVSFGLNAVVKEDFLTCLSPDDDSLRFYRKTLDLIRIADIEKPLNKLESPPPEVEYFRAGTDVKRFFHDGNWLQRIMYKMLYESIRGSGREDDLHIVYTDKLFGTFGLKRYHARVVLTGQPSIISTSGLVEAPARPREYYFARAGYVQSGRDVKELDYMFESSFVKYNDERITPILCSYTLQAVLYNAAGKEFCNNKNCCNHNSHWQSEVINVQLSRILCKECRKLIDNLVE